MMQKIDPANLEWLLQEYGYQYPKERTSQQRMLHFLRSQPACFERSCLEGHFTVSAFLINYSGDSALLMHHTKLGIWLQPGGHCDGNADIYAVAAQEVQEETGITSVAFVQPHIFDIDIHSIPTIGNESAHWHYDVRLLMRVTDPHACIQRNAESLDMQWFGACRHLLPTQEVSVLRMFEKWQIIQGT